MFKPSGILHPDYAYTDSPAKTGIVITNLPAKSAVSVSIDANDAESTSRWFMCSFARRSPEHHTDLAVN